MKYTNEYKWWRTLEWLRLQFPAHEPIIVRRFKLDKVCGNCERKDKHFLIRIHCPSAYRIQLDTLFHEWAHALSWFAAPGIDDHGGEWGLAYARIYSAFVRWNYGKGEN